MRKRKGRLPGGELIGQGLRDLSRRRRTQGAWLVSIGAPRLRSLGIPVRRPFPRPELGLYELLRAQDAAHSRFNALVRRLTSFERAAACANRGRGEGLF